MKTKRSVSILLAAVFCMASLFGCAGGGGNSTDTQSQTNTTPTSPEIAGYTWEMFGGAEYKDNTVTVPKGGYIRCTDEDLPSTYILECDLSATQFPSSGIVINNHEDQPYYVLSVNSKIDKIQLSRFYNDTISTAASAYFDAETGAEYHVKLVVFNSYIRVYIGESADKMSEYQILDTKIEKYKPNCISVLGADNDVTVKNIEIKDNEMKLAADERYINPIASGADPYVFYHDGVYYLYSTNAPMEGYKVSTSTDLSNWTDKGFCLKKGDVYGEPDGSSGFWAPEVYYYEGKFYMIYTVAQHLGVAVADSPLGPFTSPNQSFLNNNHKEIDGHLFFDDDGKVYIFFVRTGRTNGRPHGNEIFGAEFDMKTLTYKNPKCLLYPENQGSWEWVGNYGYVTEGPAILKHEGRYYMTYSANGYTSQDYAIGLAISDSPLGTYNKYANNPILKKNPAIDVYGPGHHCFTTSPDGTELFMVYHKHKSDKEVHGRLICIDRAYFAYDASLGYDVLKVVGPTSTVQPIPSGMKK